MQLKTSERIIEMKQELNIRGDVAFAKLAGASKSVVGQWLNGKIKSIHPRYAYALEKKTGFNARWILLGQGPKKSEENKENKSQLSAKDTDLNEKIESLIQHLSDKDIMIIYNLMKVMNKAKNDDVSTIGITKIKKKKIRKAG